MLEQAIVDAKALREAALKNAEQAIIEKYAPEIKKAVDSLLEESNDKEDEKEVIKEEQEVSADTGFSAPHAFNPLDTGESVQYNSKFDEPVYEFNLMDFEPKEGATQEPEMDLGGLETLDAPETPQGAEEPAEAGGGDELDLGDLDALQESKNKDYKQGYSDAMGGFDPHEELPDDAVDNYMDGYKAGEAERLEQDAKAGREIKNLKKENNEEEDDIMEQIMELLGEMDDDLLEEELIVDTSMQKNGTFETNEATLQYMQELELAKKESTKYKEENEALEEKLKELKESFKKLRLKNKQYKSVVEKINEKLNETLLSNAKLLYSNKTLCDASLNERQKSKIVEAIAKAKTPEEAKALCEALNATVTSGNKKHNPRTLSESVQRKSNLSGILPRRNKQVNESTEHLFAEKMKKLAGIK
tara:strand:+ start:3745 stop:4995 length:1251 start_codon:yes stop_codon:yes gene_type:complete